MPDEDIEAPEFIEKGEEENKYGKNVFFTIGYTLIVFFSMITAAAIVGIFSEKAASDVVTIIGFLAIWVLPIQYYRLREYKYAQHLRSQEKIGKIYFVTGFYMLLCWIGGLISFILMVSGGPTSWYPPFLFWLGLLLYLPLLVAVLIFG